MYELDVQVFKFIHLGWHSSFLDPIFFLLTWTGDGGVQTALVFLGLLTPIGRRLFWPLITALVVGGIVGAQGLKHLIPRDRPSLLPFSHPYEKLYYNSFPSGHTTSSFALAMVLALFFAGTRRAKWGYAALGLAFCVGLSRIYRGVHWPSDVLGGILCGSAFGALSFYCFRGRLAKSESDNRSD